VAAEGKQLEQLLRVRLRALAPANAAFADRYLGPTDAPRAAPRHPVHVVYGGAHLFGAETFAKVGAVARAALERHAPDAANFAEVFQRYRDRGAVRGRILSLDGFEAGLNSDIATVRWAYLDDAGDPLWESMFTYNLYRFPDGTKIVSGGADRSAKIWNTADNKELGTLAGHKDWVTSAAFNPDGSRLATASLDGVVKMWDVASRGEQEGPEAVKSSLWAVVFAPDGKSLFIGSHAGGRIVPVPEPKLLPPPPPPPPQPQWVALVPTAFASAAGATAAIGADGVVLVTGNRAKDTYTLKAVVPAGGNLRGVRLEALADDSLPGKGPGRADNGNFVVSTFGVQFGPSGSAETPTAIAFAAAKADFEQENYGVAGTIDDKPDSGWAIGGGTGARHLATYDLPADLVVRATSPLTAFLDPL
jgi:hypothetical protein